MHFRWSPQYFKYLAYSLASIRMKTVFLFFNPFSLFCFKVWPWDTWTQHRCWSLRNEERAPSVGDTNRQPSQTSPRAGLNTSTQTQLKPPTLRPQTELGRLWSTYFFILIGCALSIWLDMQQVFLFWLQLMQLTDFIQKPAGELLNQESLTTILCTLHNNSN